MNIFTVLVASLIFGLNINAYASKSIHQIIGQNEDATDEVSSLKVKRTTLEDMVKKFKTDRKEPLLGLPKKDDLLNTLKKNKASLKPSKPLFNTLGSPNPQSKALHDIQSRFKEMMAKARLSAPAPQLKLRSDLNKEEKINLAAKYKKLHEDIKKRIEEANTKIKSTESTIKLRNRIDTDDGKVGRISLPKRLESKSAPKKSEVVSAAKETSVSSTTETSKIVSTVTSTTKALSDPIPEETKEEKIANTSEKVSMAIDKIKTMQKDSVSQIKSKLSEIMSKNQ